MRTSRPWNDAVSPSLYTRPVPATTVPSTVACIHASPPFTATRITAAVYATVTVRVSVTLALVLFRRATTTNVCGPAGVVIRASQRPPGCVIGTANPLTATFVASVEPLMTTAAFSTRAPLVGESTMSLIGGALPATCGCRSTLRFTRLTLPDGSRTSTTMWFAPAVSVTDALNVPSASGLMSASVSGPGNTWIVTRPSGTVFPRTTYDVSCAIASVAGSFTSRSGATAKDVNW